MYECILLDRSPEVSFILTMEIHESELVINSSLKERLLYTVYIARPGLIFFIQYTQHGIKFHNSEYKLTCRGKSRHGAFIQEVEDNLFQRRQMNREMEGYRLLQK